MIPAASWLKVLAYCGVPWTIAVQWSKTFESGVQPELFSQGARELDDFVGQVLHETRCLQKLEESLNYSAKRMTEVWASRFPSIASAEPYAYQPEKLANKVYGGRLGNVKPGDGWLYRGRGIPMITGQVNYLLLQDLTAIGLVEKPDLLLNPDIAIRCAILWWEKKVPDSAIDCVERVTCAVNGGEIGLIDRKTLTERAGTALRAAGVEIG